MSSNESTDSVIKSEKDYYVFITVRDGEKDRSQLIQNEIVGGRDGIRTRNPLLAKQVGENTKVLRWCRLHGLSTKFSLSKCTEVVPSFLGLSNLSAIEIPSD